MCNILLYLGHVITAPDSSRNTLSQIARFMGLTWGPTRSWRPQMGPILAPRTLLSGYAIYIILSSPVASFANMVYCIRNWLQCSPWLKRCACNYSVFYGIMFGKERSFENAISKFSVLMNTFLEVSEFQNTLLLKNYSFVAASFYWFVSMQQNMVIHASSDSPRIYGLLLYGSDV